MNFFELIKRCAEQPESLIKSPKTFANTKAEIKNAVDAAVSYIWDYTDWAFKYADDTAKESFSDLPCVNADAIRIPGLVEQNDEIVLPENPAMRRAYINSIVWKANILALSDPTSEEHTSYVAYLAESLGLMNKYAEDTPETPPGFTIG